LLGVNSLLLDVSGWTLAGQAPDRRLWTQPDTDPDSALSVLFFDMPPDTPPLDDIGALRDFYRRVALANQAGMIEVSPWSANGCRGVLTILKLPQVPTGVTYVGSITMPLSASSFVVKIGCAERGVTGTREALVASSLIKSGQLQIDPETNNLVDWSRDPYDATRRDPLMRNLSEDPQYDERFPQHPLSRLRRYLAQVAPSIRLQDGAAVKT
jgi:hypothetical protein